MLVLYELQGMSGNEIAELLGIRVQQVWVVLHRARAALERKLSEAGVRDALAWEHAQ